MDRGRKGRVIIDTTTGDYLKDEICCVVEPSSRVYKNHPEALSKSIRALQKAIRYVQKNPEETARLMAEKIMLPGILM
ncbi:MAG: hypothetical protein LBD58_07625 [Treponema sp.]|nr:hypothetical protein [Treponema sp.]